MTTSLEVPHSASAVVIGGGVIGASVAYHLAKLGWNDVLLLERRQFACGTTWHAAGLIGTMRANESLAKLCEYSMSVLADIEQETGQSTGFRQVGSLSIAHSPARFEELKRVAAMNNAFGVTQVDIITPAEVKDLYPIIDTAGLLGASWVAHDGTASPIDVTAAFIKGARGRGARCLEGVTVTEILRQHGRVAGVLTDHGEVRAEYVVNCAGMWGRELGRLAGVNVPLHACEQLLRPHRKVSRSDCQYCRCYATTTTAPICAKTPAVCWSGRSSPTPAPGVWTVSLKTFVSTSCRASLNSSCTRYWRP